MSAGVRLTIRRRPSVSTAMWRLRPTIFLPASYPLVFASGALTDWLSTTPPVGLARSDERRVGEWCPRAPPAGRAGARARPLFLLRPLLFFFFFSFGNFCPIGCRRRPRLGS